MEYSNAEQQNKERKEKKSKSKVNILFTNIVIKFIISLILLISSILIIKILSSNIKKTKVEIENLDAKNKAIVIQTTSIVNKSIAAKKYIKLWNEDLNEKQKELSGISIETVQTQIDKIASNQNIILNSVAFSPTVITSGSFEKMSVVTYSTLVTIKFSTITDINAFKFLDDLKKNLDNFIIVTEINLKRTKKITPDFLKQLNSGLPLSAIDGEFKVRLYGIEQKK